MRPVEIVKTSYETWWQTFHTHAFGGREGLFIHPFADPAVIAGNGTIGLEIPKDLRDVDSIVVPFGGGGLSCGIAAARSVSYPDWGGEHEAEWTGSSGTL